jgi:hypothetical protein
MLETQFIKSKRVREILGGISTATLYRYWHDYKVLPQPKVVRGINFWLRSDVETALEKVQAAG